MRERELVTISPSSKARSANTPTVSPPRFVISLTFLWRPVAQGNPPGLLYQWPEQPLRTSRVRGSLSACSAVNSASDRRTGLILRCAGIEVCQKSWTIHRFAELLAVEVFPHRTHSVSMLCSGVKRLLLLKPLSLWSCHSLFSQSEQPVAGVEWGSHDLQNFGELWMLSWDQEHHLDRQHLLRPSRAFAWA